ncbi:MAG: OmpH family outer membrane protein [Mariniblastus sp.]|nr:OmpH family outer membrane protein [Mariniblastus sp.]MDG2183006.1 OmpH family outer membrane protein [Mariniblastus sp.]
MKLNINKLALITAVAITLPLTGIVAQAQESGIVAILDVAAVFQKNLEFNTQMNEIKQSANELKAQITEQQKAIQIRAQEISAMESGPSRFEQEAALEQQQTQLKTLARQRETNLLNREAQIYYVTYQKLQSVVAAVAEANGIVLVLRFDNSPINGNVRPEVIKAVNRSVVYNNQLDLTNLVAQQMGPQVVADNAGTQLK